MRTPANWSLRVDQAINVQKFATVFVIYGMMNFYDNFSVYAWVYLGLHGIYGYTWLIKDLAFPNGAFQKRMTILGVPPGFCTIFIGSETWKWPVSRATRMAAALPGCVPASKPKADMLGAIGSM